MAHVPRPPFDASTTPVTDRKGRLGLFWTLTKTIALPLLPIGLMMIYGQPALRMQYWYSGSYEHPIYTRCIYLALDGWHDVMPHGYGPNACPPIAFLPFELSDLFGGDR